MRKQVPDVIDVRCERLDRGPAEVEAARALLAPDERERAASFRFAADRRRYTVARAGLRRLLASILAVPPESLQFETGPYGKPSLAGRLRGCLDFNVTHSHELALFALCASGPVGVDVEWLHDFPDYEAIARVHFTASERAALREHSPSDRKLAFFQCWTCKEAFIKAVGEGLSYPLHRFEVTLAVDAPTRIVSIDGNPAAAASWSLFSLDPEPGYVAAVVAPRAPVALRLHRSG